MSDNKERYESVQKYDTIKDGELCLLSTELFHLKDNLLTINDEYKAIKKKLERMRLEAQLQNAKVEEKLAEWQVKAKKVPEVQEAMKRYGRDHIAHVFPCVEDGDDAVYLSIVSKQDIVMKEAQDRMDAVTDMLIKIQKAIDKENEN